MGAYSKGGLNRAWGLNRGFTVFSLKNENFEAITTKCHSSALLFEPRKKKFVPFFFFSLLIYQKSRGNQNYVRGLQ